MTAPRWVEAYVGIPFRERGASREGAHCLGLVSLVLKERAGVDVPAYSEFSTEDVLQIVGAIERDAVRTPWCAVSGPLVPLDVVTMRTPVTVDGVERLIEGHVGIMVSATDLLHVEEGRSAVVVPIDHRAIRYRIVQRLRHRDLM